MRGKYYIPEIEKIKEEKLYRKRTNSSLAKRRISKRKAKISSPNLPIKKQMTFLDKIKDQRRKSNRQMVQDLVDQMANLKSELSGSRMEIPQTIPTPRRNVRGSRMSIIDSINWQKKLKMQY